MKLIEVLTMIVCLAIGILLFGYLPLKFLSLLEVRPSVQAERNRYVKWEHEDGSVLLRSKPDLLGYLIWALEDVVALFERP